MIIRNATMSDVKAMHSLLNHYADKGQLLGRSFSSLYDKLRDFKVCIDTDGVLVGLCALNIIWEDLAEIRSLAVLENSQGKKIGQKLVRACLEEANRYNITKVFTLTYKADFSENRVLKILIRANCPIRSGVIV